MGHGGSVDLKPRAITVLVALRAGARGRGGLADILCDATVQETDSLLADMRKMDLIQSMAPEFPRTWILTHAGLGWLETNGLSVTDRAKREIFELHDRANATKPHHAGRVAMPVIKLTEPAPPSDSLVHVIDQSGQPYGSTRLCCNNCGAMAVHAMKYCASREEWLRLPPAERCSLSTSDKDRL